MVALDCFRRVPSPDCQSFQVVCQRLLQHDCIIRKSRKRSNILNGGKKSVNGEIVFGYPSSKVWDSCNLLSDEIPDGRYAVVFDSAVSGAIRWLHWGHFRYSPLALDVFRTMKVCLQTGQGVLTG